MYEKITDPRAACMSAESGRVKRREELTKYETIPQAKPKLLGPKWDDTIAGYHQAQLVQ
jgi:hypothetical protein